MAARFPQSESSVAYRIKPAWASKIHAIFWAVAADKVQMLRGSDTASTVIPRASSGATFDSTNGRIIGDNTTLFNYEQSGGFGVQEKDAYSVGASYYGDGWGYNQLAHGMFSNTPPDTFGSGLKLKFESNIAWYVEDGAGTQHGSEFSDNTAGVAVIAFRHDKSDATAQVRAWANGSELSSNRVATSSATSTNVIAATGRPLYFGGSSSGTSNSKWDFEACWFATALSDADMATITSDPSSIIEVSSPSIALSPKPTTAVVSGTRTFTITRTTAAPVGGITYNLASSTPAVATVPASVVMAEGTTTKTFDATGESVGSTNISATNAADSGETDTAALTVSAPTTTTLKLLAHIDALSATAVRGAVFQPGTGGNLLGAKIGDFTGEAFEATPEAGQAPLLVPVTSFGGGSLTVSDTPKIVWEATSAAGSALGSGVTIGSTSAQNCTVVEI